MDPRVKSSRVNWTTTVRLKLLQAYIAVAEEKRTGMFTGDEWTEVAARAFKVDSSKAQKLRKSAMKQVYDLRLVYKRYLGSGAKPPRLKGPLIQELKALEGAPASPDKSPSSRSTSKEPVISGKEKETKEDSESTSRCLHASPIQKDGEVDGSEQDEGVDVIREELVSLRDWFEEEIVPLGTEIMKIVNAATVKRAASYNDALSQSNELRYSCKLIFELDQERVDSIIKTKFKELKLQLLRSLQVISTEISEELCQVLPNTLVLKTKP